MLYCTHTFKKKKKSGAVSDLSASDSLICNIMVKKGHEKPRFRHKCRLKKKKNHTPK